MGIRNTTAYSSCVFDDLKFYPAGEEYVPPVAERYYYVKDHLGSIRQTVDETGAIVAAQDYYPYGEYLRSVNNASELDKYKFTEKERDTETNLDYFGARYYNSALGMWLSVDPLADKYPGWSPYNYCTDNPLIFIDLDGKNGGPESRVFQKITKNMDDKQRADFNSGVQQANKVVGIVGGSAFIGAYASLFAPEAVAAGGCYVLRNPEKANAIAYDLIESAAAPNMPGMRLDVGDVAGKGVLKQVDEVAETGLKLSKSVTDVLGDSYQGVNEVTQQVKNTALLEKLNETSKGNWVKVFEAGELNGKKVEMHYFRNNNTGEVFDVKQKYDYWHQKEFK